MTQMEFEHCIKHNRLSYAFFVLSVMKYCLVEN